MFVLKDDPAFQARVNITHREPIREASQSRPGRCSERLGTSTHIPSRTQTRQHSGRLLAPAVHGPFGGFWHRLEIIQLPRQGKIVRALSTLPWIVARTNGSWEGGRARLELLREAVRPQRETIG